MPESVAAPQTISNSQLWMYFVAALSDTFADLEDGAQVFKLLHAAKEVAGRNVGTGRAVTPAISFGTVNGVWRTNRHGGLLGGMLGARYCGAERLRSEIDLAQRLIALRINTPQILVAAAVRDGMYWTQHLVTAEVINSQTIFDARDDEQAMLAAGKCLRKLFDAGYYASDLHPRNMLWQPDAEKVWVIDLAGAKMLGQPLTTVQRAARMKRFERYFVKHAQQMPAAIEVLRAGLRG